MILDLDQFISRERPFWDELRGMMKRQDDDPDRRMSLAEIQRFHYLYQRAASDLVKIQTFAGDVKVKNWLEDVVARAYSQLHQRRARGTPFRPWRWLFVTFPVTFRRHWKAFALSTSIFWLGAAFGAGFLMADPSLKSQLIPPQFGHLSGKPSRRVEREEKQEFDYFERRQTFSASLMTHNTKVTIMAMVFGITYGLLTVLVLFGNGLLIGVIICDYFMDGQGVFLAAWLLPHGSWELPAIFIGGQAGLIVARALFGWGTNLRLRQRLSRIRGDLLTLIGGAAVLLIWAGLVESFLSQYHGPAIYPWKIGYGIFQMAVLAGFLLFSGRNLSGEERSGRGRGDRSMA